MAGKHRAEKQEVILVSVWDTLRREPVRVYIYGVLAAVVTALVASGVLTGTLAPLIMGIVLAALALPSPVESARMKVTPMATLEQKQPTESE